VESFEDADKGLNRAWVKGGVVNPDKGNIVFIGRFLTADDRLLIN